MRQLSIITLDRRTAKVVALEVTLGWARRWGRVNTDWGDGAVGPEDTVVDEPGSGVELGVEGLNAEAVAAWVVGLGGDNVEDTVADDGL